MMHMLVLAFPSVPEPDAQKQCDDCQRDRHEEGFIIAYLALATFLFILPFPSGKNGQVACETR